MEVYSGRRFDIFRKISYNRYIITFFLTDQKESNQRKSRLLVLFRLEMQFVQGRK